MNMLDFLNLAAEMAKYNIDCNYCFYHRQKVIRKLAIDTAKELFKQDYVRNQYYAILRGYCIARLLHVR